MNEPLAPAPAPMTPHVPPTPLEPWIAAKIGCEGRPLSLEALCSYQLAKLNETLSLAQANSRFYRNLLGSEKITLSSMEELADLPFSTADQLSAAPFDFMCVRQDEVERIVTLPTSGTTGTPKRIFFTIADQELTRDFFHWGMSTLVGSGDRVLILLPGSLPGSVGDLLKDGLARMDVLGIPHGPVTDPQRALDAIREERVTALVGIPVQILELARLAAADRSHRYDGVHSVLLSTDRAPHAVVGTIERAWGCAVYNHYGTTEMGLGGGVDCRARTGYHIREADLLFEIVDPITGQPVPEGESGEVVFTTLTRRAMPLIRYRTGDVSRFALEPCPCGSVLRRLAHIDERLAGGIDLPGGTVRQKDFDEALFQLDGLADFRVLFADGRERATLALQVRPSGAGPGPSQEEVIKALHTIPPLSAEMALGSVHVNVLSWDAGDGNNTGTGKRKIVRIQGAVQ
jgi:phenylacetate-CoA ligase